MTLQFLIGHKVTLLPDHACCQC